MQNNILGGKDIIITGLQSWNFGLGSNIANMASLLSKTNRVLFVNYALDRTTLLRHRNQYVIQQYKKSKASKKLSLETVSPGLTLFTPDIVLESINQLGPRWLFDILNKKNSEKFGKKIQEAIAQLNFHDFILFSDSDFYRSFYLPEMLRPFASIYYIRDNMIATDYYKKHGARMEKMFIEKSDLVVANSEILAAYAREFNVNSYDVGQGCDLELYNPAHDLPLPDDFRDAREKYRICVGYTGALKSTRIDEPLLVHLAKTRPDYGFIFVGPEDRVFQKSSLHLMPNVIFLGRKPENQLPAYLKYFDVAINPQRINEITHGNYPRKVDEYLAMGIPVVATETATMRIFKEHTCLAKNHREFLSLIELAIAENSPDRVEKRKKLAQQHTWENNIKRIDNAFNQVFIKPPPASKL